jgi:hypothetical protein
MENPRKIKGMVGNGASCLRFPSSRVGFESRPGHSERSLRVQVTRGLFPLWGRGGRRLDTLQDLLVDAHLGTVPQLLDQRFQRLGAALGEQA